MAESQPISAVGQTVLIVAADDYGYAPSYDAGILEAARAGAIDAASTMVTRDPDPGPLLETSIEVGLHVEVEAEADRALEAVERQLERFEVLFGRPPAFIDGHHHCHAAPAVAQAIAEHAAANGIVVRSVSAGHRALLRAAGVATPDLLVGRMTEAEPPLPAEIRTLLGGGELGTATVEWMTHPGHPGGPSSYDRGRGEDLLNLLELGDRSRWAGRGISRAGPRAALRSR